MKNKIVSSLILSVMTLLPLAAQADIVSTQPLNPDGIPTVQAGPLSCFDFTSNLSLNAKSYSVRGLQAALIHDGFQIPTVEYGTFGQGTLAAVKGFQQKYASDVLKSGDAPSGIVGKMTRTKLNSLYGCNPSRLSSLNGSTTPVPSSVILNVKNVSIDSTGVTVVSCNQSPTDIPIFPVRVRLNGIIRDFNIAGALKSGVCDTTTFPYSAWGLTYDAGVTYGVVTSIDPNGSYKTAQINFALTSTTTLAIPAIQGAHLSIRGLSIKSNGIQATLCNLGSSDLQSYPVRVIVNSATRDLDVPGLKVHGVCQATTWTYDTFGLVNPAAGTVVNATVVIDPNNIIQETNEYDNSATVVGTI